MGKPRPGDWLTGDLTRLAARGADILACLMTPAELAETGLAALPQAARSAGLTFVHAPTPDRGIPDVSVLPVLLDAYRAGRHVAAHCRFGIGRSATLAAAVLVVAGAEPGTAWDAIERARGVPVPDTPAQRRWVEGLITYRGRLANGQPPTAQLGANIGPNGRCDAR
ncbi:phosphatase domain-containing putative toxin [Dactylosporangium sp. CA-233914]|uniref:phosphatase domain-containing putative toxin n=1 Tax=Dactylosporangium sp. CA-233914 TaxID=3239934 RepID=UPI003D90CB08